MMLYLARRISSGKFQSSFARVSAVIAVTSVALGCMALQIALCVLEGYQQAIVTAATTLAGAVECRSNTSGALYLQSSTRYQLSKIDGVRGVHPTVRCEILMRSKSSVEGGFLLGYDSISIREAIVPLIQQGSAPQQGHPGGIPKCVLGQTFAKRLNVQVGDTVTSFLQVGERSQARPTVQQWVVSAISAAGLEELDATMVCANINDVQRATERTIAEITHLRITTNESESARSIAENVKRSVPEHVEVRTWHDQFPGISTWIELQKQPIPIVLALITLVAIACVMSTLIISVVEKTRSVAILQTLGVAPSTLLLLFLVRAFFVACTGALFGTTVSFLALGIQQQWAVISLDSSLYYVRTLPVAFTTGAFVYVPLGTIALCCIAAVVPAWLVARIQPATALQST
jgi:lipoprotein-releasing system permease protein